MIDIPKEADRLISGLKSAAYRQGREDALEEAVKLLEERRDYYLQAATSYRPEVTGDMSKTMNTAYGVTYKQAAERIRALKGEK